MRSLHNWHVLWHYYMINLINSSISIISLINHKFYSRILYSDVRFSICLYTVSNKWAYYTRGAYIFGMHSLRTYRAYIFRKWMNIFKQTWLKELLYLRWPYYLTYITHVYKYNARQYRIYNIEVLYIKHNMKCTCSISVHSIVTWPCVLCVMQIECHCYPDYFCCYSVSE